MNPNDDCHIDRKGGQSHFRYESSHIHRNGKFGIEKGKAYITLVCGEIENHANGTAHIFPQKARANPDQVNHNVCSMNWWFWLRYRTDGRATLNREDGWPIQARQSRTATPLAARAKVRAILVKRIGTVRRTIRYRPAESPTSPRNEKSTLVTKSKSGMTDKSDKEGTLPRPLDKKYIFVKKGTTSEQTLPLQTTGQRADCRGRVFTFRQELFRRATVFPIRCSSQRASPILNFRTEQIR